MEFSESLKSLRKEYKIDQNKLASELKVSPKTISHWETGYTEPSIAQLISLSKIFNVSLDELITGK
ncbi:MAG: helix-turn-helix transcriptional regulator [Clostridia bacterium]|nr:helix-turn-helix transcriptional regulator [Clostridia bacterium]